MLAPSQFFPVRYLCRRRCRHLRSRPSGSANSTAMRNTPPFSNLTRRAGRWRSMRSTAPAAFWEKLEVVSRDDGGNPGDAARVADKLAIGQGLNILCGTFLSNVGLAITEFAGQEKSLFPRGRTADRQDYLAGRQPLYLPSAALDLHASGNAATRGAGGKEEAVGPGLSELRVRPVRRRRLQGADESASTRHRVRHRAGVAGRQDRCRRGGAGDR